MPSVSIVLGSGNADIDGVLSGLRWSSGALTFSFPTAAAQFGYAVPGFQALNAAQQNAVKASLAAYASVANLSFTQVTESSSTHGTLRFAESDDSGTAYAYTRPPTRSAATPSSITTTTTVRQGHLFPT